MNRLAALLLFLAVAGSAFADSATVIFTPRLSTYRPLTNVLVTIRPLSVPSSDGVGEQAINSITNRTGTSTNLEVELYTPGTYEISYLSTNPLYRTVFTNDFPNTNGTVYSRDFIASSVNVSGLMAYSKAQSDARFALRTNAVQGIYIDGAALATRGITNLNFVGATGMVSGATATIGGFSGGGGTGEVTTAQLLVVSNYVTAATNSAQVTNWITSRQPASTVLSNLANTASNNVDYVTALTTLTNVANTASNRTWTADSWNTNRVNAALTNNNAGAVTLSSSLTVAGTTLMQGTVQASDSSFTGTDTVIGRSGGTATLVSKTLSVSTSSNLSGIHNTTQVGTNFARVFEGTSTSDESAISISNGYFRGRLNANNITQTNVTADRVAVYNSAKNLTNSAVTIAELETINSKQSGSLNLTNWSNIPTGAMANIPAVTFLTNWANAISNLTASVSGGSTNAITNASPASAGYGAIPILVNRVTATNSGIIVTNGTNISGVGSLIVGGVQTNTAGIYLAGSGAGTLTLHGATSGQTVITQASNEKTNTITLGLGTPSDGQVIQYHNASGTWTNTTPAAGSGSTQMVTFAAGSATITNSLRFGVTNIIVSTTNLVLLDVKAWQIFRLHLLTNTHICFTNVEDGILRGNVWLMQDTNGTRELISWKSATGLLQTNAGVTMGLTTNANSRDLLEFSTGDSATNLAVHWPKNFLPSTPFTNSLAEGGSTSYLINENFEGAGTPSGWTAAGSPDFDFASDPLAGSQSLQVNATGGEQAYYNFGSGLYATLYVKFKFRVGGSLPSGDAYFFTLSDDGVIQQARVYVTPTGAMGLDHAGITTTTTDTISVDTTYFGWLRYTKGTGANGVGSFGWSTTDSRPTSGNKFTSTSSGQGTANIQYVQCVLSEAIDARYDNVQVAETLFE